jgi:glutaredoxin-like protein
MSEEAGRILIYGASWCPDATRSRKYFDDNGIAYQWLDIDEDAAAEKFVRSRNKGRVVVPTILFSDGSVLVEPSDEELARKLESLGD